MGMQFTDEQQAVIDARDSNVLVSAAAGSGKTTVLVERIIQKITEENGTGIDRLLVVTFTKAAAAQMKEKVLAEIQKKLQEDPGNEHLQKQETLVHSAQITTIDSFCQYIIRNNFNEIGLDPSYRVLDEGEKQLIMADVLEDLLEEKYAEKDDSFIECMNYFATGSNDKAVEDFILQLYKYSMSMPWPEKWLEERSGDYRIDGEIFEQQDFVKRSKLNVAYDLLECRDKMEQAEHICEESDGPHGYGTQIEGEKEILERIVTKLGIEESEENVYKISFDELRALVLDISFDRLPGGKSDPSVNTDKREYVKGLRDEVRNKVKKINSGFFSEDKETVVKHMDMAAGPVETLCKLAILFKKKFDEKKRDKGVIDFNDMEHMALDILVKYDPEKNTVTPTPAALSYRDYYDEVMIDEYQDSNNVQELLLSAVSGEGNGVYNRFMVGDVKQSIYKFRLACPEIFMDKMQTYNWDNDANERKIVLHNNFRSRNRVLDSVNYIFEQIMGKDLGGVTYDEDAFLRTGANYPEAPAESRNSFDTELLFADTSGMSSKDSRVTEARLIASRIHELRKNGIVTGGEDEYRPVKYSDIVILLRAQSGWDTVFKKELEDRGIPVYVESRTGYFSASEVVTILNLLRVLDNPLWDVPLVSVMHSAIGGFSDEELAIIKARDIKTDKSLSDGESFYEIMLRSRLSEEYPELSHKVEAFADMIDDFRDKAVYLPVNELIRYILDDTGYKEYCSALPGGEKRCANLDMLIEKAADFEKTSYRGVFHFVRYIEQLGKYEVDYGEANILDENADVVRIMSIHKSKGLEFPVVFLAGMSKKINFRDASQSLCLDMDMGIGTYGMDVSKRIKYRTLRKSAMEDYMKMDTLGEEMRILYVAMTRAKEKLIMIGEIGFSQGDRRSASDFRTVLKNLENLKNRKENSKDQPFLLPYYRRKGASSYQDLVLMAFARHPSFDRFMSIVCDEEEPSKLAGTYISGTEGEEAEEASKYSPSEPPFTLCIMSEDEINSEEIEKEVSHEVRLRKLLDAPTDSEKEWMESFENKFGFKYAFDNYNKLFVKTTVTELKKEKLQEEFEGAKTLIDDQTRVIPAFMGNAEELRGAARGTVYHKIMELLYEEGKETPDERIADFDGWMDELVAGKRIAQDAVSCVDKSDIKKFFDCSAGRRMKEAFGKNRLYRESPFMMGVEASRINDDLPEEELVLIQGIIDVWFEEDDGLVLLDYKTDKVSEGTELVKKYSLQLDYYQEALEKITGKNVKERIIYSFTLGEEIGL